MAAKRKAKAKHPKARAQRRRGKKAKRGRSSGYTQRQRGRRTPKNLPAPYKSAEKDPLYYTDLRKPMEIDVDHRNQPAESVYYMNDEPDRVYMDTGGRIKPSLRAKRSHPRKGR